MENKELDNIILEFNDGSKQEVKKGFAADFKENGDVTFNMINLEGKDLEIIVGSVFQLAEHLGLLEEESEESEYA